MFYTNNTSDVNFTTWTNLTLAFSDMNDVTNMTSEINEHFLNRITNNYFLIVNGLNFDTFYYLRLQITFKEGLHYQKPFMTPAWAFILPSGKLGSSNNQGSD